MLRMARGFLFLALVTMLLVVVGCAGGMTGEGVPTQGELTGEELQQIAAQATTATAVANTSRFDGHMSILTEAIGGVQQGKMVIVTDTNGVMDRVDEEMQMTMSMSMEIPDEDKQE